MMGHEPVLIEEAIGRLGLRSGAVVLDGTVGCGGHAERIAQVIGGKGRLIGLDQDPEAIEVSRERLRPYGGTAMLFHENFRNFDRCLAEAGQPGVDAMLLDLGVSSPQLDRPERGFTFREDGPLDMRMNPTQGTTAAELVNRMGEKELADLFFRFGEERFSRRIAQRIVETRRKQAIQTTRELENVVFHAVPRPARYGRIHPATRVFQALRIAVNQELESLEDFLQKAPNFLLPKGRIVILSFHSLEDRIVKHRFREWTRAHLGRELKSKPEVPGAEETGRNPRARSAKLRAWERAEETAR